MPVIRWEEPGPEPRRGEDGWAYAIAKELRERPGEWAVVLELEAESANAARSSIHALIDQDNLWVEIRRRGSLLTVYACWSKRKPEPSSSSAIVYTFRKPGEAGNEETVDEDGGTSPTEKSADLGHQVGKTRRRWWQPR